MDCSTIIVSYNTFALTCEAVRTALSAAPGIEHEVIVFDNASPDQSGPRLTDAFADDSRVQIVAHADNVGFAAGNNRAAERATGRVLFFLNSDTVVLGDAVSQLVAFIDRHPEAGAVGPFVRNTDGTEQRSTADFPSPSRILDHHFHTNDIAAFVLRRKAVQAHGARPVGIVKGCALAVSRVVFDRAGGWDETQFLYAEEEELCFSLQEQGYVNMIEPAAEIIHYGGQSTQDRYTHFHLLSTQSGVAFLRRHYSPGLVALDRASGVLSYATRAALFSALRRLNPSRADNYRLRGEAASALWRWYLHAH